VVLASAAGAAASLISVGNINVPDLVRALRASPIQQRGRPDPRLSHAQLAALDAQIAQRDPGRIWIAVVSPLSVRATSDLTHALSDAINSDGIVIVVAGSNYHVTTTWEAVEVARRRLSDAVDRPGDPLSVQLRRVIDMFAAADTAAGHPGSQSSEQTSTNPGSSGTGSGSSGGGSAGLIVGVIVLAIVLIVAAVLLVPRVRRSRRAAHWRREQQDDARSQTQAALVKLGEDISALDIDSSMPNANPHGRDEYASAIDCYQEAEERLRHPDDAYQFDRAQQALRRGAGHIREAERLLSAPSGAEAVQDRGGE
jgi:hypothetical protein